MKALEVVLTGIPGAYVIRPKQPGPNVLAWMRKQGWLDNRRVTRIVPERPAKGEAI